MTLASCSTDDFVGVTSDPELETQKEKEIFFSRKVEGTTRAYPALETEAATFKVYATKGASFEQVYNNYAVWHQKEGTETPKTQTNPAYWEYVGTGDQTYTMNDGTTGTVTLAAEQTIKYWDYNAPSYLFYGIAPYDATNVIYNVGTTATNINTKTDGQLSTAVLKGIGGHLTHGTDQSYKTYYLTEPTEVARADYNNTVTLTFRRNMAKVRVGVYETIPGYDIKEIKFYRTVISENGSIRKVGGSGQNYVILNRQNRAFTGGQGDATVTYDNANHSYGFTYDLTGANIKDSYQWHAATLPVAGGFLAKSSKDANLFGEHEAEMDAQQYFPVLPTPLGYTEMPITICCDYVLESVDATKENITVTGARATIPAEYTKWENNHAYTYLFKISENTNGTTGTVDPSDPSNPDPNDPSDPIDPSDDPTDPDNPDYPDNPDPDPSDPDFPDVPDPTDPTPGTTDPEGLYPITFDAYVEDYVDDNNQGTTTTVTTPSITTYQNGCDVEATGLKYVVNKDIIIRVMKDNTPCDLTGKVNVYKLSGDYAYNKTAEQNISGLTAITLTTSDSKAYSFTPTEAATFVIKYSDGSSVAYKVVAVGKDNE